MKKNFRVMETEHGTVFGTGYDTAAEALAGADDCNARMKPEHQTYVAVELVQVNAPVTYEEALGMWDRAAATRMQLTPIRIEDANGHFVSTASSPEEAVRIIEHQLTRWHRTVHVVNACGDFPAPCNCDDPSTHNGH